MSIHKRCGILLAAAALSGCTQLPLNGPTHRDIVSGASVHMAAHRDAIAYDYALIDLTPAVLEGLERVGSESLHSSFGSHDSAPPPLRIGVGDALQISVFESASGGLFIPAESGPRPANFVTIPTQMVSRAGTVSVPYAGVVRAAGRPAADVEREIERKLAKRAIEPQAVITLIEQNASSVSVVGDTLNAASKFKLSGAGERVLDMISRAGGTKFPGYELFVTLQRNGRRATIHFPRLIADPRENVFVLPGDTIYVYREQQKFVAVGALGTSAQTSGLTGQFAFDQERLSLNEGLARAGGLQDSRANPSQVFVYRLEHRKTLTKMGVDLSAAPAEQELIPTVYRANFRDPSSFFFAQRFMMRNKDVIYAANSDATEVGKFMGYVRSVTSTVSGVATDVAVTREIFDGRHVLGTNN